MYSPLEVLCYYVLMKRSQLQLWFMISKSWRNETFRFWAQLSNKLRILKQNAIKIPELSHEVCVDNQNCKYVYIAHKHEWCNIVKLNRWYVRCIAAAIKISADWMLSHEINIPTAATKWRLWQFYPAHAAPPSLPL